MKSIVLDKNSSHYWLARKAGFQLNPYEEYNNHDICTYTKYVLGGLLVVLILLAGFAVVSAAVIHMIMGFAFSIYFGTFLMTEIGVVGLLTSGVLALLFVVVYAKNRYDNYKWNKTYKKSEPGFISIAYRSWKDKFCTRITFVGNEDEEA